MFHLKSAAAAAGLLCLFVLPAEAGGFRYSGDDRSFFLFDLFSSAPNSIYRKPQVRGFKRRVGGYSYKYQDSWTFRPSAPTDFGPLFDGSRFGGRIITDGPDNF